MGSVKPYVGLSLLPDRTNAVSAAALMASGHAEPQETKPGVDHVGSHVSGPQARLGMIRPTEHAPSKVYPNPCFASFYCAVIFEVSVQSLCLYTHTLISSGCFCTTSACIKTCI